MLALVVNGKTRPQPPVHRMTALRGDRLDPPGRQLDRDDAVHPAVVDQQPGDEPLVVARDLVVLQRGLEQRVQHVEAGLVGGEPGAHLLHAAERADRDVPVGLPAPRAAPVLQLEQLARAPPRRTPRRRPGRTASRCPRWCRRRARRGCRRRRSTAGRAALGGDRVAAHRVDLRDHGHVEPRVGLGDGDGGAQAGAAAADDQHVVRGGHRAVTHRAAPRPTSTLPLWWTTMRWTLPSWNSSRVLRHPQE